MDRFWEPRLPAFWNKNLLNCLQGVGREEREEVTRPSGLAAPAASPTVFQEEEVSGCDVAVALLKVKDGVLGRVILIGLGPWTLEKSRDIL